MSKREIVIMMAEVILGPILFVGLGAAIAAMLLELS